MAPLLQSRNRDILTRSSTHYLGGLLTHSVLAFPFQRLTTALEPILQSCLNSLITNINKKSNTASVLAALGHI